MARMMTENDPIDFGKYQGTPLKDVPASYLMWCLLNDRITPAVKRYVKENFDKIQKQVDYEKAKRTKTGIDNSHK